MKKLIPVVCALLFSTIVKSQDSTKTVSHEIGFNTVLLVKQLISNNPTSSLDQLPYSVFYNMYYKNTTGLRLGLGLSNSNYKTTIEGQPQPRNTKQNNLDLRVGVSYNFIKTNKLTLNAFLDGIYKHSSNKTVNTQTTSSSTGTLTNTTTTTDNIEGSGGQIGVGVKYNLFKHLSLYIEVPLSFVNANHTSQVEIAKANVLTQKSSTKDVISSTNITLPTTLYLVLRF